MALRTVRRTSVVPAPVDEVWARVTDAGGINHELVPLMQMTFPRALRAQSLDEVPLGVPLGRARIFYLGFLPVDHDDLVITELVPGSHFQEVSTMASMRRWEHRRELRHLGEGMTELIDVVGFEPRLPALGALLHPVVRLLFAHRHRRLVSHFTSRVGRGH